MNWYMSSGIALFVLIVSLAVALRVGWRPRWRPATPTTPPPPVAPHGGGHGGGHGHAAVVVARGPNPWAIFGWIAGIVLAIVTVGSLVVWVLVPLWHSIGESFTYHKPAPSYARAQEVIPSPVDPYHKTPATITIDSAFNIESDHDIVMKFPDEEPVTYKASKGCQHFQPIWPGPKQFWDPRDKENGVVDFRTYTGVTACPLERK